MCNLRCSYCFEENKNNRVMSLNTATKFINKILPVPDDKFFNGYIKEFDNKLAGCTLIFVGGECTLYIKLIDNIIQCFLNKVKETNTDLKFYNIIIETNGTKLTTEEWNNFYNKYEDHLSIGLSFEGCSSYHDACRRDLNNNGSFNNVLDGVRNLISKKKKFQNTIVLSPHNISHLFDCYLGIREVGLKNMDAYIQCEPIWTKEQEDIYNEQLMMIANDMLKVNDGFIYKAFYNDYMEDDCYSSCGTTGFQITLSYDGDIYSCYKFSDSTIPTWLRDKFNLGNVDEGITKPENYLKLRSLNDNLKIPDKCKKCKIATGCPKCPAYNYKHNGDVAIDTKTWCNMVQITAKVAKYYKDKMKEMYNIDIGNINKYGE